MAIVIKPQPWYQEAVLSSQADIVVSWSGAWVGKTFALLLDPMRWFDDWYFWGVILRRTMPWIKASDWPWDKSKRLYWGLGWVPTDSKHMWVFPKSLKQGSMASITFTHLEYEKDLETHQGAAYPFIWMDELTHFTRKQFIYMLSRNRAKWPCKVRPYMRCTCNPDPESWVKEIIEWWLDKDWYPIQERSGVIRYFINKNDNFIWWDTREEVYEANKEYLDEFLEKSPDLTIEDLIKSFTFIYWKIEENKELLSNNPWYLAGLIAQDEDTKLALLGWCWAARQDDKAIVNYKLLQNFEKNFPKSKDGQFVSCDVAWFWKDLAVIIYWEWWVMKEVWVYTKSSPEDLLSKIEDIRERMSVPVSNVIYDNDWLGWGLSGNEYVCFNGEATPLEVNGVKEQYKNLKTQMYFHMIEDNVNKADIGIDMNEIYVDWVRTDEVYLAHKDRVYKVLDLIKQDIKAIKRDKTDNEGKKCIIPKKQQKALLGWRSPDFWDTIMMRKYFDFVDLWEIAYISFEELENMEIEEREKEE